MTTEHPIYDFLEDGAAYLNALKSGATLEVTRTTFDYFLEVLPPVYFSRQLVIDGQERLVSFGFAEGMEPIKAFWQEKRGEQLHYFCQRTKEINRG